MDQVCNDTKYVSGCAECGDFKITDTTTGCNMPGSDLCPYCLLVPTLHNDCLQSLTKALFWDLRP